MDSYELIETLSELSTDGVLPPWEIPVETDTDKLVGISMGLPRSEEQMKDLEGKMVVWVPFIVADYEETENG